MGVAYALSSLCGRAAQVKTPFGQAERTNDVARTILAPTLQNQIEELLNSSEFSQKLFTVDGHKIAVVANPSNEIRVYGLINATASVIVVSEQNTPSAIKEQITSKIPSRFIYSSIIPNVIQKLDFRLC